MAKAAVGGAGGGAGKGADGAGMEKADLKRMLRFARQEPIQVAFALDGDGKAVVQMDKRKQGRALEKTIKEGAPESKSHRWGTVVADPDDPKLAVFQVNKASSGMSRKLILALKGTGFSKVRIVLDDGSEVETHEEEDDTAQDDTAQDDGAEGGGANGRDGDDAGGRAGMADPELRARDGQQEDDGAGRNGEQESGQPDAGELARELTGLVRQMLDVIKRDPMQKAALAELATDAQASLKRGDLDQAAAGIEILRQAIGIDSGRSDEEVLADGGDKGGDADADRGGEGQGGDPEDAPPEQLDDGALVVFAKSQRAWMATRAKVDSEIRKLHASIMSANEGDFGDDLEGSFLTAVEPVLATLDESLSDILSEAAQVTDAAESEMLKKQARATLARYMKFVQSEPIIKHLDANPFVPLQIGKTLSATLSTLSGMMR